MGRYRTPHVTPVCTVAVPDPTSASAAPDARADFWRAFEGAYGALLTATSHALGRQRPDRQVRGTTRLRTRDALLLADGIAGLAANLQRAREGNS